MRFMQLLEFVEGILIQVIVMIMTHQDHIDFREVLYFAWNLSISFRTKELERRTTLWKHRIDENVDVVADANQSRWMPNPRVFNFIVRASEVGIFIYRQHLLQFCQVIRNRKILVFSSPLVKGRKFLQESLGHKGILYLFESKIKSRWEKGVDSGRGFIICEAFFDLNSRVVIVELGGEGEFWQESTRRPRRDVKKCKH